MLTAFVRAFQTPDLRKKLLVTLGLIALFRFGASLPTPGISEANVAFCSNAATQGSTAGVLAIVNLLSGQALLRLSVFALGIMPYITASIILQLLTVVIPRLETLKQEGQAGQAKITQYTRYLTVGLAVLQSTGYVELAKSGTLFNGCGASGTANALIPNASTFTIATMVITMRKVDVFVKGPGSGRETAIRSLQATGLEVGSIQDMTPVPHNGCRPPKRRRV